MKKLLLTAAQLICICFGVYSQVDINKAINLSNTNPADAKVSGIKTVGSAQDAVSAEVLQKGNLVYGGTSTYDGPTNTYTVSFTPAITTFTPGMVINFKANSANAATPATQIKTGVITAEIKKNISTSLSAGDIATNQVVSIIYDGSAFQLIAGALPAGSNNYVQNRIVDGAFATGQVASLDITGSGEVNGSFKVNGNVGIGNVSPSLGLMVEKDNGFGWTAFIKSSGTANGVMLGTRSTLGTIQGFSADGNSYRALLLNPEGMFVGIGVALPTNLLTVGNTTAQTTALIAARGGGNSFEWGHGNQSGYGNTIGANTGGGQPFIAFNAEAGSTGNTFRTRGVAGTVIMGDLAGGLSINSVVGSLADNQTLTTRMVISGGNVGIGTPSPDYPLTVQSAGDAQVSLKNAAGTTKAYIGTSGVFGAGSTDDLKIRSEATNILFGFSGFESMRITSTGRLGIGVPAPAERLDISGGNIKMGYEIVTLDVPAASAAPAWYYATCPTGKAALGGSCGTGNGTYATNTDITSNSFGCYKWGTPSATNWQIKVVCANMK